MVSNQITKLYDNNETYKFNSYIHDDAVYLVKSILTYIADLILLYIMKLSIFQKKSVCPISRELNTKGQHL